jgi:hypothetical protein
MVATLKLGMTIHPTAHLVYKMMMKIDNQLKSSSNSSLPHIANMIEPMQNKFNKYWSQMKDFAAINQVFDPRYKLDRIEFILSEELGQSQASTSINKIKDLLTTWFNNVITKKNKSLAQTTSTPIPEETNLANKLTSLDDDNKRYEQYLKQRKATQSVSTTAELDLYLQEPPVLTDSKFSVLSWWGTNSGRFPMLAILAKSILMTPMTSIAL